MAWPIDNIDTTDLDQGTDSPSNARADLLNALNIIKGILAERGATDGVCELVDGLIPTARIPTQSSQWEVGDVRMHGRPLASVSPGWVSLCGPGTTIGNEFSNATALASAECEALFAVLWPNTTMALFTSTGASASRGASADSDWAANRQIALPIVAGRAPIGQGQGAGLTNRSPLQGGGGEGVALAQTNLPPASGATLSAQGPFGSVVVSEPNPGLATHEIVTSGTPNSRFLSLDLTHYHGITGFGGSSTPFTIMQPFMPFGFEMKL